MRAGILQWNKAFERIGVSGAIEVQDQPTDGTYDPDDIRYNVIRWVTDAVPDFGAEAQIVWDPRTGEIFRGGVLIDSGIVRRARFGYKNLIAPGVSADEITPIVPHRGAYLPLHDEAAYGAGMHAELMFGETALQLMYGTGANIDGFSRDLLEAVTLHEVGHDFGLSHNFIGHGAYTAAELQSKGFTAAHGVASSVWNTLRSTSGRRGRRKGTTGKPRSVRTTTTPSTGATPRFPAPARRRARSPR